MSPDLQSPLPAGPSRPQEVPARPARRPRVVVVAQASPARGGIATFAESVVSDPVLGASFDLVLLNTTRKAIRTAGTPTLSNAWHAVQDAARVYRAARRADVVHVQTALMPSLPLMRALALCRAGRLAGCGVLCHAHTGLINAGPAEAFSPSRLQRFLLKRFRFVHAMLTVSEAGSNGLRPHTPGLRVERVDNGIDVQGFRQASPDSGDPTVLFVGTLARRKGLLDLAEAIRRVQEGGLTAFGVEIVGSGSEAGEEEAAAVRTAFRSIGLERSLLGPLHGAALGERLERASLYVLPSHSEGQPIGILEAMASGLPVIATRIGAIPDMIREGVDGLLVDPSRPDLLAEAVRTLVESPHLRVSMGRSARARAEDLFGVDALREHLAGLYREAATRAHGRGREPR